MWWAACVWWNMSLYDTWSLRLLPVFVTWVGKRGAQFLWKMIDVALIVLYFLHSTSVLSFYIDVVWTLSTMISHTVTNKIMWLAFDISWPLTRLFHPYDLCVLHRSRALPVIYVKHMACVINTFSPRSLNRLSRLVMLTCVATFPSCVPNCMVLALYKSIKPIIRSRCKCNRNCSYFEFARQNLAKSCLVELQGQHDFNELCHVC